MEPSLLTSSPPTLSHRDMARPPHEGNAMLSSMHSISQKGMFYMMLTDVRCSLWNLFNLAHLKEIVSIRSSFFKIQLLRLSLSDGPNWVGSFPPIHLLMGTDLVSETLCVSSMSQIRNSIQHALHMTNQPLSQIFRELSLVHYCGPFCAVVSATRGTNTSAYS